MMRSNQKAWVCLHRFLFCAVVALFAKPIQGATPETLFTTQTPQLLGASDGSTTNYELGMRFTSGVAGQINAIRFWKSSRESGTHVGRIWNATGQLLATATFASETSSGWQQQALATPLAVSANTVYVVSVNTGNTYYVTTDYGLASKVANRDLSSVVGGDGVYGSPGRFPANTWNASNYFRDVVFTPTATAALTSNPSSVNLGSVDVGSTVSQALALTNNASSSVTISKISASGTGFSTGAPTMPVTLAAGKQISVQVKYTPTSMGTASGSLSVASNASNPTLAVALSGVGMQGKLSAVPASVAFGGVSSGVSNTQTVTVTDAGNKNVTISAATASGSGFGVTGPALPVTLTPNHSVSFTVRFSPTAATTYSGSLSLTNNAQYSPLLIALSGSGATQTLQLTANPSSINFGNVTTSSSAKQTVTLKNSGNSSVSVSKLSASGSYFSVGGLLLPITLAPGQTATFAGTFAPTAAGTFNGSASVVSTAANSPLSIPLTGVGGQLPVHSATLSWAASTSSVSGYNVYRGNTSGGPYTKLTSTLASAGSYRDTTVQTGLTYYYVVTSVQSNGTESVHSSEVSAKIP